MAKLDKIRERVLQGGRDHSLSFKELLTLAHSLPLKSRAGGKHAHIFTGTDKNNLPVFLNLQPDKGHKAKLYQVHQVRNALKQLGIEK